MDSASGAFKMAMSDPALPPSSPLPSLAVQVQDLTYSWPGDSRPCLQIDDFRIATGERVFLFGPSGSGKTTLLNLLAGLLQPSRGSIHIDGTPLDTLGANARDRFRASHMGIIFQQFNLVPYLSVFDNLRLARHFSGHGAGHDRTALRADAALLLQRLGLAPDLLQRRPATLSVGQQQRIAVIRALINHPALIIADEPSSALDTDARDAFIDLLVRLSSERGSTVLFISHDRSLRHHFDRAVDLRDINRSGAEAS